MEITEVRIFPIKKEDDKLKAFATITLDNCFVVRDLKIIQGNSGLFIAMPSRKKRDGTYADIAHPVDSQTRQMIENTIIQEYQRMLESNPQQTEEYSPQSQLPNPDQTPPTENIGL